MPFRNTQYLLQVNADGTFRHGQVDRVEVLPGGREVSAPPLDFEQADLGKLLEEVNQSLLKENVTLKSQAAQAAIDKQNELDSINQSVATAVKAKDSQIASLTAQLASAQSELVSAGDLRNRVGSLQNELAELHAKLVKTIEKIPFDLRKLKVESFLARMSQEELLRLSTDDDPGVQAIIGRLMAKFKRAPDDPERYVNLDSDSMVKSVAYLLANGRITEERAKSIAVDATEEESLPPTI
jgi:uncharacterized small protein (DUF1192 family)